jgi:Holliday junction resolvase RusA-like endonuclease
METDAVITDSITFEITGRAVGKVLEPFTYVKDGKTIAGLHKSSKTKKFMKRVELCALPHAPSEPWTGPVELLISIYREYLQGHLKSPSKLRRAQTCRILPTSKPDNDNVSKAITDSFNNLIFVDDAQVVTLVVTKRYAERSYVVVTLNRIEDAELSAQLVAERQGCLF